MPLKEVNLKTTIEYKKAIHADVTKITDSSAVKFWIYKDIELPDDKGKKLKIAAFVALVDIAGIKNAMRGKKLLCTGTCRLESGKVEFKPLKGKVPYTKLKTVLPVYFGKQLHMPSNAEELEGEEGEGFDDDADVESSAPGPQATTPPIAPPQPTTPDPALANRWTALLKEAQAAAAAIPARKDQLMHAAQGIPELIKANNVKEATEKMDALKALIQAPPPPTAPDPALVTRWGALLKEAQAAAAANPGRKDALMHAAQGIPELIKANNVKEATEKMDALKAMIQAPAPPTAPDPALVTRWGALLKEAQAAAAANPSRKDALMHAAQGIPELIKGNHGKEATEKMDALKALIQAPPPSSGPDPALLTAWNGLLKEMQAAVAANPGRKDALQKAGAGIPDLIKSNPAEAKKRMDAIAAMLAKSEESETEEGEGETTEKENPAAAKFEKRYDTLEKRFLEIIKDPFVDAGPLRGTIGFAKEKAEALDFAGAEKALDRLENLLKEAAESSEEPNNAKPYKGIVEYRKSLLAFDKARKTVDAQVAALAKAISALSADHDDLADEIEEQLSSLNEDIGDAIDEAMSQSENVGSPISEAVKSSIQKYLNDVASSPLVKRADSNPFGVTVSIEKTLGAALQKVQQSLPVPA